ncbi:violet-sensitive opsin-like [Argopecten irradians]|uniref:violet-sensitive opsin-like n=1 Tax=Argopecten irradians TaxID=31199 RepID=UPI0037165A11
MDWNDTCHNGVATRAIYCYPNSPVCVQPTLVGLQIFFLICVIILSVTSCALLIYVVYWMRSMTVSMKAFIISLSVAYIVSSMYPIPILGYSIVFPHLAFSDSVCQSSPVVVMVTSISTNWTLALVGVDRFLTIFRPFTYPLTMNLRKSVLMALSTWVVGIAFAIQPCLGWRDLGICFQPRTLQICGATWHSSKGYSYASWTLTVAAPLCILVFCYSKIALFARSLVVPASGPGNVVIRIPSNSNVRPEHRKLQPKRSITSCLKTFKIVIINIGTICLCWAPYSVLSVMSLDTARRASVTYGQDFMGYCLLFLPNFVNPVVFIVFNKDYRESVSRLWNRVRHREGHSFAVSAISRSRRPRDSTRYDNLSTVTHVRTTRTMRRATSTRHM